jgi:hypothetical protein
MWRGHRFVPMGTMIITPTRVHRMAITVRTGSQTASLSAPAPGITHIGAAGTLAAVGAMPVKDTAAVTGAATLAVAPETDMPAVATGAAATAADMPEAARMPETAPTSEADTVGAVNLTVVADPMVEAVASTVAVDMVADAGNPLH